MIDAKLKWLAWAWIGIHVLNAQAENLPADPQPFQGHIELRVRDSKPAWPELPKAPEGAPNVVVILLDDVGFGSTSPFGGPVDTATINRIAQDGLRYNRFHVVGICTPTRASLLTGRNHQSIGMALPSEVSTGYPGYHTMLGRDSATIARILKEHGYSTAWFGKNHLVPLWEQSQAGPFDRWPQALGFDYFYGFLHGATNQWRPAIVENTTPIRPYLNNPDYHFDDDIADHAIGWLRSQQALAPGKPFFIYYAPGAAHEPLQPRPEYVAKYKGRFDSGWDTLREQILARQKAQGIVPKNTKLTPRPAGIPAWNTLTAQQKRIYARMMEIWAGFLDMADRNIGRVLDEIAAQGKRDNTLVIYIAGDNGSSAEGGPNGKLNTTTMYNGVQENLDEVERQLDDMGSWKTDNHFPAGWAVATDTPFQWTKLIASHLGGTRTGLAVSWPARIRGRGEIRSQWEHVIDIAPTILEAVGIQPPEAVDGIRQKPIEGSSMLATFNDAQAPSRHVRQYFEVHANRAMYLDGWMASTTPLAAPWDATHQIPVDVIDGYGWELYNLGRDFSQADNLAAKHPDKLRQLQQAFYEDAARYQVLPLDDSKASRMNGDLVGRPNPLRGQRELTYYPGMIRIPQGSMPNLLNKSYRLTAEVTLPTATTSGMLMTEGGLPGGLGFWLERGVPVFHFNRVGVEHFEVRATAPVPAGRHVIVAQVDYDGGGLGKGAAVELLVDGASVAKGRVERTVPFTFTVDEGMDVGEDSGTPVSLAYDVPFRFEGMLHKLTVSLGTASAGRQQATAHGQ